jgi:hypothetical protein
MLREGSAMASPTRKLVNGLAVVLTVLAVLVTFGTSAEAQQVTQIRARIITADVAGAGTNAKVFLGVAGREFRIDREGVADFEQGQDVTYIFGVVNPMTDPGCPEPTGPGCAIDNITGQTSRIANAADNDPRLGGVTVDEALMRDLPIYIRMSDVSFDPADPLTFPDDDWLVTDGPLRGSFNIQVRSGNNGEQLRIFATNPQIQRLNAGQFLRLGSTTGFYLYFIRD